MIILWYADFDGTDEDLVKVKSIFNEITKKIGGEIDGPYYPQSESLLYIAKVKNFEWLNQSGRIFLKRIKEERIKITPVRYEVATTPEEFWGK